MARRSRKPTAGSGRQPARPFQLAGWVRPTTTAKLPVAFVALYSFGGLTGDGAASSTASGMAAACQVPSGQTMLLGVPDGTVAPVPLRAARPLTLPILAAAASASSRWVAMAVAPTFPGTAWYGPAFGDASARPLGVSPQQLLTCALCGGTAVAVALFFTDQVVIGG